MAPWLDTLLSEFERILPNNGSILALEEGEKKLKRMVKDPEVFASFADHLSDKSLMLAVLASGKKIGFLHNCFEKGGALLGITGFTATSPLRSFSAVGACWGLVSGSLAPSIGQTLVPLVKQLLQCKTKKDLMNVTGDRSTQDLQVGKFATEPAIFIWTPTLLSHLIEGDKPYVTAINFLSALVNYTAEKVATKTYTIEEIETSWGGKLASLWIVAKGWAAPTTDSQAGRGAGR
jgi:hypothetical protein